MKNKKKRSLERRYIKSHNPPDTIYNRIISDSDYNSKVVMVDFFDYRGKITRHNELDVSKAYLYLPKDTNCCVEFICQYKEYLMQPGHDIILSSGCACEESLFRKSKLIDFHTIVNGLPEKEINFIFNNCILGTIGIAEHSVNKNIMEFLISDKDVFNTRLRLKDFHIAVSIASAIAINLRAPEEILEALSNHYWDKVRSNVAKNPNVSLMTIKKLVHDKNSFVKSTAKANPKYLQTLSGKIENTFDKIDNFIKKFGL